MGFLVQLGALVQSHCICTLVMRPAFKRQGGGNLTRWVWQLHPNIKRVLIGYTRKGRNLGAPIRNILIITPSTLATEGVGLTPRENFHNYIPYNTEESPFANTIRKLQDVIFGIEKTITRHWMILIQSYWQAGAGKIIELGTLPLMKRTMLC